jgi:hypothetical protein
MFDHLRDCIMGVRPEMLPMGECWGECACECHKIYEAVIAAE